MPRLNGFCTQNIRQLYLYTTQLNFIFTQSSLPLLPSHNLKHMMMLLLQKKRKNLKPCELLRAGILISNHTHKNILKKIETLRNVINVFFEIVDVIVKM